MRKFKHRDPGKLSLVVELESCPGGAMAFCPAAKAETSNVKIQTPQIRGKQSIIVELGNGPGGARAFCPAATGDFEYENSNYKIFKRLSPIVPHGDCPGWGNGVLPRRQSENFECENLNA